MIYIFSKHCEDLCSYQPKAVSGLQIVRRQFKISSCWIKLCIHTVHAYHGFYHLKQMVQLYLPPSVQLELGIAHTAA